MPPHIGYFSVSLAFLDSIYIYCLSTAVLHSVIEGIISDKVTMAISWNLLLRFKVCIKIDQRIRISTNICNINIVPGNVHLDVLDPSKDGVVLFVFKIH